MATSTSTLEAIKYYSRDFYDQYGDPRVAHYPLMRTPWPIVAMCISYLWFVKFAPGGNSAIFPFLNTFIHTIMYSYYFLATIQSARPYLGWKKYITQFQIVQFIIMILHSTQPLFVPDCQFPRTFLYINIFFSIVFIYLFTTFYISNYGEKTIRVAQTVGRRLSQQVTHGVRRLSTIGGQPQVALATHQESGQSTSDHQRQLRRGSRQEASWRPASLMAHHGKQD